MSRHDYQDFVKLSNGPRKMMEERDYLEYCQSERSWSDRLIHAEEVRKCLAELPEEPSQGQEVNVEAMSEDRRMR